VKRSEGKGSDRDGEEMTKARFYIKGMVQDVGYRPYIMKEIIKRKGLNGIADNYNLEEDSVEVLLEGEEKRIVDFYDFLKIEGNKPREAKVKEIGELEFLNLGSISIHVPKASEYSQALTFEQLGKGIPMLKNMYRSIEGMSTRIERMNENIKGMREEMWAGFDKLPERIAKELKEVLR